MNIIKQIVGDKSQTIKMIVKDNERGAQGEQGEPGVAATIAAGNAYSVQSNVSPSVVNTGTSSAAVFDFYIPKGEKGATGADGKDGKDGRDGRDGSIQYTAGTGINITAENVIEATGAAVATWGGITGTLSNQTDLKNALDAKQGTLTAGTNIIISDSNEVSAIDTVYSDFAGTTGQQAGVAGLVPAPATTDADKYLKSNGLWETVALPTVNDATLTIQQNGTNVATFTANSSSNATANITTPVITMTNADPGEGSDLAPNNFVAVYGATPYSTDYSTIEVDSGLRWIDGSIIYKKTVNTGALPDTTTKQVAHGVSNLHRVIDAEGYAYRSTDGTTFPLPFVSEAANLSISMTFGDTYILITTGSDRSNITESYVTLYYTKNS